MSVIFKTNGKPKECIIKINNAMRINMDQTHAMNIFAVNHFQYRFYNID